jgi:hypothetical protein
MSLLPSGTAKATFEALSELPLEPYQPFTLCALDPALEVLIGDWNGTSLTTSTTGRPGLIRTSSGRDQAEAERVRSAVLGEMAPQPEDLTPEVLDRFHRSHLPERGPFSACMHREEAETQSLTVVTVDEARASMSYVAGSPCLMTPPVTRTLPIDRRTG